MNSMSNLLVKNTHKNINALQLGPPHQVSTVFQCCATEINVFHTYSHGDYKCTTVFCSSLPPLLF